MTAKKRDYTLAIGRRKAAVAKVRMHHKDVDALKIEVNEKDFKDYFNYFEWQETITSPLVLVGREKSHITVHLDGGGTKSQAEAIRLGIARALVMLDPEMKATMRKAGFLTIDARVKERKKPGLKKARRAPQWSKR